MLQHYSVATRKKLWSITDTLTHWHSIAHFNNVESSLTYTFSEDIDLLSVHSHILHVGLIPLSFFLLIGSLLSLCRFRLNKYGCFIFDFIMISFQFTSRLVNSSSPSMARLLLFRPNLNIWMISDISIPDMISGLYISIPQCRPWLYVQPKRELNRCLTNQTAPSVISNNVIHVNLQSTSLNGEWLTHNVNDVNV